LRAAGRVMAQRDDHQVALYGTDILGSIAHYLEGGELCSLQYTLYGYDSGKLCASVLRFNSQRKDRSIEGYHLGNGHRTYSPTCMRFNSSDTLSPHDEGGLNAYSYCGGDPINRSDPSGRSWRLLSYLRRLLFGKSSRIKSRIKTRNLTDVIPPKQEQLHRDMSKKLNVHNKIVTREFIASEYGGDFSGRVQRLEDGRVELLEDSKMLLGIEAVSRHAKVSAMMAYSFPTRSNINKAKQFSAAEDYLSKLQLQIRS